MQECEAGTMTSEPEAAAAVSDREQNPLAHCGESILEMLHEPIAPGHHGLLLRLRQRTADGLRE